MRNTKREAENKTGGASYVLAGSCRTLRIKVPVSRQKRKTTRKAKALKIFQICHRKPNPEVDAKHDAWARTHVYQHEASSL